MAGGIRLCFSFMYTKTRLIYLLLRAAVRPISTLVCVGAEVTNSCNSIILLSVQFNKSAMAIVYCRTFWWAACIIIWLEIVLCASYMYALNIVNAVWELAMATRIKLRHKDTGIEKDGFYGFSWTTFFFGAFPCLFRMDFITFIGFFVIQCIIGACTIGIGVFITSFVWAFIYNKYYTRKLLEKGYVFADSPERVTFAKMALGIA